jgi:hypothetical protein
MPDNLTIQIGADSSKLRSDLDLAKAKLRDLNAEMTKLARDAQKTGDRTRLDQLSVEAEKAAVSVQRLRRAQAAQYKDSTVQTENAVRGMKALGTAALEVRGALLGAFGVGGGIGAAITGIVNMLGKAKDELLEVHRLSLSTGFAPTTIQALKDAGEDVGSDVGQRALIQLSQAFSKVTQESDAAGRSVSGTVQVLKGGAGELNNNLQALSRGVEVFRGGGKEKPIQTEADAFAFFGVDIKAIRTIKDAGERMRTLTQQLIDGMDRRRKQAEQMPGIMERANLAAGQIFGGRGITEMTAAFEQLTTAQGGLAAKEAEIRAQQRDANAQRIAEAKAYQKSLKDIGDEYTALSMAFLNAFGPTVSGQLRLLTDDLNTIATILRDIQSIVNGTWNWPSPPGWLMRFLGAGPDTLPPPNFPPVFEAPIPRASGGMIRGTGTATSDSILARLSNGEFVFSAAAVRHWGPQMLAAMNGLRMPRFAAGGFVGTPTAGGTPVHLHLGGQSFALSGTQNVVSALVVEAHRQQIRSAGVKPSWYGGR